MAAVARFGFLGIEVFEGTASADAHLQVDLKDPGTTAADGRIDLRELVGTVDHPDTLVSAAVTGSADLSLPLRAPFLGITGTTPTPDNTLTVSIPDFGDLSTATVQLPAALRDVGNFANIDAASLTGLLGQLTFWLDEFRRSDTFANFDVPLVGPALDKVLGVADAFRDKLLLDDADNGLDDAKTLLFDLNAALSAAGLGDRLRAENVGGKIKLIANDAHRRPVHRRRGDRPGLLRPPDVERAGYRHLRVRHGRQRGPGRRKAHHHRCDVHGHDRRRGAGHRHGDQGLDRRQHGRRRRPVEAGQRR